MAEFPDPSIPLFPLGSSLFPKARMPLQIFEARYLDLVKHCMKTDTGFGVVMIEQGTEVYQRGNDEIPRLASVGCYARIVDWNALPHNRLGITVEGGERFSPGPLSVAGDQLLNSEVHWWQPESDSPLPENMADMAQMLTELLQHPQVAKLGYQVEMASATAVGCQLAQLIPVDEVRKLELLSIRDPLVRLGIIDHLIQQMT
jgi:Lon protease-like protein